MMRFLGIAFVLALAAEILSLVWMVSWIGGFWTLVLMVLGVCTGLFMLRRMGISGVLLAVSAARSGGRLSFYQLLWPVRYAAAGVLLMSPGFASTLLAVLLMLPFGGRAAPVQAQANRFYAQDGDIIEGEFTVNPQPSARPRIGERRDHH